MPSLYRPLGLIGLIALCAACTSGPAPDPRAETARQPVIYGDDDRTDYYASESALFRSITLEAIVALVPNGVIDDSDPDDIRFNASTLQEWRNLCDDQRFLDQPTAANCSGTLIDDDLVLTAGHCVTSDASCRSQSYVFDYFYASEGELETVSADDVYGCEELIVQALGGGLDYAILQLDRPVNADRQPAAVRLEDSALAVGQNVPVVGFGSGLPAKIDLGGSVLDARAGTLDYFIASTDTFGGNSGSGVFTAAGEVVGILVRGETDYVSNGSCNVVNELSDPPGGGQGEDITYVARAIEHLCIDENFPSARLCGGPTGEGWCDPCDGADGCPADWTCQGLPDLSGTFCALGCAGDDDCRSDHSCSPDGFCEPNRQARCFGGDVWLYDACGRQVVRADDCTDAEVCTNGACQARPAGDSCNNATSISAISQVLTGNMGAGYFPDSEGSCAGAGPDRVYRFALDRAARFEATASGFDTVLYLRESCDDPASEVACNDDDNPPDRAARIAATLDPGAYYLFLDAWSSSVGEFSLDVEFDFDFEPPPGDLCAAPTVLSPVSQTVTGTLTDHSPDYAGSCGGAGPERVYMMTLNEPQRLTALASGFDTVLYLRSSCADANSELVCNDDIDTGQDRRSSIDVSLEPGTYYLFMDAWSSNVGDYTLDIDLEEGCEDMCEPDARRCLDDDLQICVLTPSGCGVWATRDCGVGRTCSAAVCIDGCVDDCSTVGQRECLTDVRWHECSDIDGDGCLEWGPTQGCPGATFCDVGICVCANECAPGQRRCAGDLLVEECILTDAACPSWVPALECEGASVCDNGECVSLCSNGCPVFGALQCTADGRVQECGQWDDDDCFEWSAAQSCPDGNACVGDSCVFVCEDECDVGERRCGDGTVEVCITNVNGCDVWLVEEVCDANERCTQNGDNVECEGTCQDECELGDRICDETGTSVLVCTEATVACPAYRLDEVCGAGQECIAGACVDLCRDACDEGARRCSEGSADVIEICEVSEEGCTVWRGGPDCGDLGGCVAGECEGGCVDECDDDGGAECVTATEFRECSDLDGDGCLEWHLTAACPAGQLCVGEGACESDCVVDELEPNDEADEAVLLDPDIYGEIYACSSDDDWFAVGVLAGEELVITVQPEDPVPADAVVDLDLELFADDTLELLDGSYLEGHVTERLRYSAVENEILLVRVFVAEDTFQGGAYVLGLTLGTGPDDDCQREERRCSATGNGIEKCVLADDGRLVWSAPDPCGDGRTCEAGYCMGGIRSTPDAGGPSIDAGGDASAVGLAGRDVGCGCGVSGTSDGAAGAWFFLALGGFAVLHRRRRRLG